MSRQDWTGRVLEVTLGAVGHGGFCVARHEGRVVFVRHGLPGERVRATVTEDAGGSYCRADATEILEASPDRVPVRCPAAGPGGCGGCDFQHVDLAAQRVLKADVLAEALERLGGTPLRVEVEELAGGHDGLGWRTRLRLAVTDGGGLGLHVHRSATVRELEECPQAVPGLIDGLAGRRWTPGAEVVVVGDGDGGRHVVELVPVPDTRRPRRGRRPRTRPRSVEGTPHAVEHAAGRRWAVSSTGFWQGHVGAAEVYSEVVAGWAAAPEGGTAWDLYAGVGLFASVLAGQVGPRGQVVAVEASTSAAADAAAALADLTQVEVVTGAVERVVGGLARPVDVVVCDPQRSGAGAAVVEAIASAAPSRVVYVACDPAALARDVALLRARGYGLSRLRAFDAFPMTHHVESIALFECTGEPVQRAPGG